MTSSTISTIVTTGVTLGRANYPGPLTNTPSSYVKSAGSYWRRQQ